MEQIADTQHEHGLTGKWVSPGMQIIFGSPMEKGMAKLSGVTDEPSQSMDYTVYETDGILWIRFQNDVGERSYKIVHLTKKELVIENSQGKIELKRADEQLISKSQ